MGVFGLPEAYQERSMTEINKRIFYTCDSK